jgi:RNA polymerase sigma-70 factor, ECF subfamily
LTPPGGYRFQQLPLSIRRVCATCPQNRSRSCSPNGTRETKRRSKISFLWSTRNFTRWLTHYLRGERPDHTLQTTALIHEAYLRLAVQGPFPTENRNHFVAIAATLMRQILVDYARNHRADKRGADCTIRLEDNIDPVLDNEKDVDVLSYSTMPLTQLAQRDPRQSRIVELRFLAGMTVEETAAVMGISPATVKRDWTMARAWLSRRIKRGESGDKGRVAKN